MYVRYLGYGCFKINMFANIIQIFRYLEIIYKQLIRRYISFYYINRNRFLLLGRSFLELNKG